MMSRESFLEYNLILVINLINIILITFIITAIATDQAALVLEVKLEARLKTPQKRLVEIVLISMRLHRSFYFLIFH